MIYLKPVNGRVTTHDSKDQIEFDTRIHEIIIVTMWSSSVDCTKMQWRPDIMHHLQISEWRNTMKSIRINRNCTQLVEITECHTVHQIGYTEYLEYDQNCGRWWVEDGIWTELWCLSVGSYAFRTNHHTRIVSIILQWCTPTISGYFLQRIPPRHSPMQLYPGRTPKTHQRSNDCTKEAGLHLNVEKCEFHQWEAMYLGQIVEVHGIRMDPGKVAAVREVDAPTKLMEVQVFSEFANFYRRFMRKYSRVVHPVTKLS